MALPATLPRTALTRFRRDFLNPEGPVRSFGADALTENKRVQRGSWFLCTDQHCPATWYALAGEGEVTTSFLCMREVTAKQR